MLSAKDLTQFIKQVTEARNISEDRMKEIVGEALGAAYKKEYGNKDQKVKAQFNPDSDNIDFYLIKQVVDRSVAAETVEELERLKKEGTEEENLKKFLFNPEKHIWIEEAEKIKSDARVGDEFMFALPYKTDFGRIAAQTAKQVLQQKIREAQKETVLKNFKDKEGGIVSGTIQRREGSNVFVDLNQTLGILPVEEQIPGEYYKPGQRMRFLLKSVDTAMHGPEVILSRAHTKFLTQLLKLEIPEIASDTVEVKAIVREPGIRAKVAVASNEEGVDPIGTCVGSKGTRIWAIMQELGMEKIDIILWSPSTEEFIKNALSPAKAETVQIEENIAKVTVAEDQFPIAIGKEGTNIKLASELTGWKIELVKMGEENVEPEATTQIEKPTPSEEEKKEEQSK